MLLDDFKHAVDSCSATISPDNLEQVCQELEIDTTNGYGRSQVTDKLYQSIRDALHLDSEDNPDKISKRKLLKLQSELVYRHVLYGEDPVEYLKTLKVIQDSCRQDGNYFPPFSDTNKWEKAIISCKNYNTFSPSTHSILFGKIRDDYPKDFDIATSVMRLVEKGCEIEITNSDIQIKTGLEVVVNELREKIKAVGGIVVAKSLFNHLNQLKKYSTRFERYFITREASGISFDQRPQIPFGFLLNLSLKYPYENIKVKKPQALLNEIIDLAITISNGAYGVQHYNFWEFHFQSGETIIQFCTEIALWDSMFTIPQCRPSSALEICDNLFSFVRDTDFKRATGFSMQEFLQVSNAINQLTLDTHSPTTVYHSAITKTLNHIDKNTIQNILDFISHPTAVNENYSLPSDYSSIDFGQKPLMKLGATKFLLANKSWCAPNYFESLATPLREYFKLLKRDLDNELGGQLEIYLQNKLTSKGITFVTGDYDVDGIHGECDLLIESEKSIILIEFKKKVLTRKSKSGIDINILLDLSDSILAAQLQAGRTEIILREKGSITLNSKDGKTKIVNFNDRQIERVALTQLEFGGFQDRSIINQFLKSLLTHSFGTHSKDANIIKKFEKLAEKQAVWVEQYNKLYDLDKGFAHFPFFNCWFLSLPQLMEVIDISTDNNSFYETFRKTKHVSMNTLDWYKEFDIATKLQHEAK